MIHGRWGGGKVAGPVTLRSAHQHRFLRIIAIGGPLPVHIDAILKQAVFAVEAKEAAALLDGTPLRPDELRVRNARISRAGSAKLSPDRVLLLNKAIVGAPVHSARSSLAKLFFKLLQPLAPERMLVDQLRSVLEAVTFGAAPLTLECKVRLACAALRTAECSVNGIHAIGDELHRQCGMPECIVQVWRANRKLQPDAALTVLADE